MRITRRTFLATTIGATAFSILAPGSARAQAADVSNKRLEEAAEVIER